MVAPALDLSQIVGRDTLPTLQSSCHTIKRMSVGTWLKLAFCPWIKHSEVCVQIPIRIKFLERDRDEDRRAQLSLLSLVSGEDLPQDLDPSPEAGIAADGLGDFAARSHSISIEGVWIDLAQCQHAALARKRMFEGSYCFISIDVGPQVLISRAQIISARAGAQGQVLLHFLGLPSNALGALERFLEQSALRLTAASGVGQKSESVAIAKSA